MPQKLQLSGRICRHRITLFNQHLEMVVHPCDLVLQLLICCKPDQLADSDESRLSNCSNVLDLCPQVVDRCIGIHVTDVILTNVQEHIQSWLKLAVDPPAVIWCTGYGRWTGGGAAGVTCAAAGLLFIIGLIHTAYTQPSG